LENYKKVLHQSIDQPWAAGKFSLNYDLNSNRIVDLERSPPPSMAAFGKINLELWDVSGDFSNEKCWPAI
jgi:hypothetical protein